MSSTQGTREENQKGLLLEFSPEAYRQLRNIREEINARTNAEVVCNALSLYEWFLQQKKENFRFQLVKDDLVKEVEVIF